MKKTKNREDEKGVQPTDVVMSLRLDGAMHERLRKLAFDQKEPMREFIVRGIEKILREEKY